MIKHDFPKIYFYDRDFVDIYNKAWAMLGEFWETSEVHIGRQEDEEDKRGARFTSSRGGVTFIDQGETILSSFFLVYSNRNFPAGAGIDYFYAKQEADGAIRGRYDAVSESGIMTSDNPLGVGLPLFPWAEYNLYHKGAHKKRVREVLPHLKDYIAWIDRNFKRENGLYAAPYTASGMVNSPREGCVYPVDFNAAMAISASYMSALGDILNDKDVSFMYRKMYFSIKTRINSMMWDGESGFYYDLAEDGSRLNEKTIAGFSPLLAEIPNADRAEMLIGHLTNPSTFGSDHPIPSLSADSTYFSESGNGYRGSVFPFYNYMVIKGLEKYQKYELCRECAIKHIYYMLDCGRALEAYLPNGDGVPSMEGESEFPQKNHLATSCLSTIALMIENIVGLTISLPRKTVDWTIPNMEKMGIENLLLRRNLIKIQSERTTSRGWKIAMESEKLYYFTLNVLGRTKKTLPIPSGKCTMIIDKI